MPGEAPPPFQRAGHPALAAVLGLVVLTAYLPVLSNGFVGFDDDQYIVRNERVLDGVSLEGVRWAFTTEALGNWHPLTWISHMLDVELFGLYPGGHHATSLALHIANTTLVYLLLSALTGRRWPSVFVAAVFGVHPLHVESVAWAAERKDVLSTLLWLSATALWLRHLRTGIVAVRWGVTALFALGLAAKPMPITFPFVLLLLDWWPLGRVMPQGSARFLARAITLIAEKAPLFLLSSLSAGITWHAQQAAGTLSLDLSIAARVLNSADAYLRYLFRTAWPFSLAVFYPHPGDEVIGPRAWAAVSLLTVLTAGLLLVSRRRPFLGFGWLWYLGTLVPVIGLIQAGAQAAADRYTYVPLLGIFIALAWGVPSILPGGRMGRGLPPLLASIAVAAFVPLTRAQVERWRDPRVLFSHAAAVIKGNYLAVMNLGNLERMDGDAVAAIDRYREALAVSPRYPETWYNLGLALMDRGDAPAAEAAFREAVRLHPRHAEAWNNLGALLARQARHTEAIPALEEALRLRPDYRLARENLRMARTAVAHSAPPR